MSRQETGNSVETAGMCPCNPQKIAPEDRNRSLGIAVASIRKVMRKQLLAAAALVVTGTVVFPPAAKAHDLGHEPDVAVEVTKLDTVIEKKQREITLNNAELLALQMSSGEALEKQSERNRLTLANEVLRSEIEDLMIQKGRLLGPLSARAPGPSF